MERGDEEGIDSQPAANSCAAIRPSAASARKMEPVEPILFFMSGKKSHAGPFLWLGLPAIQHARLLVTRAEESTSRPAETNFPQ